MGQIKTIKGKVAHKHETEADWELSSYVPEAGEIVIYDKDSNHDHPRIKVGDGETVVSSLKFVDPGKIGEIDLYGIDLRLNTPDGKTLYFENDGRGWIIYPDEGYAKLGSKQGSEYITVGAENAGNEPGNGIVFKTGSRSLEIGSTGDIHAYTSIIMGGMEQMDSKTIWMDGMGLHSETGNTKRIGDEIAPFDAIYGHTGKFVNIDGYDQNDLDINSKGAITLSQSGDVCLCITSGAELELPRGARIGGAVELLNSHSLTAGGNITAKNYLQGKWIQSTQLSSLPAASKICVFDKDGWIYYRDIDDLGVRDTKSTSSHSFYLKGYNNGFEDGGINSVDGANNAVFGDHNNLILEYTDEPMSCIVGGSDNRVSTSFSIVGGVANEVRGTGYNCLVVGRWNSIGDHTSGGIDTPSKNNIVGGEENVVFGVDSMIVGTKNNIQGSYNIVGGASNTIFNNGESNIVGGSRNHIDAYSILAVGNDNYIAPTEGMYINYAAAIGWGNRIEHNNAYTFGWGLQTNGQAQFLVGNYNDTTVPGSIRFAVAGGEDANHRANLLTVTSTSTTVHGNLYSQNHTVNGDSTVRGNQTVTGNAAVRGSLDAGSINMSLTQETDVDTEEIYQTSIAPASIQTYYRDSVYDIATITMDKGTIKLVSGPEFAEEWQSKLYLAPDHISINGETFTAADIRKMKAFLATIAD